MPSPSTADALIRDAARTVNIIATGETLTADEANDGLSDLNDILELMSTENLFIYGQANQSFTTVAGQASYTIGTGGNFNTTRPVRIHDAYCTFNGVDFPVTIIGQEEYDLIPLKTQQQQIIERLLFVNDYPLGLITLWPTPAAAIPLVLMIDRVMTQIPSLATVLNYPPGYLLYLRNQLAIAMSSDYGITPDQDTIETARTAKASIKRANRLQRRASFDLGLATRYPYFWQTGP